jgi:hypothetical protein
MSDDDTDPDGTPGDASPKAEPASVPRWRRVVAVVLLVVGFVLVPLSAIAIWSRNQLLSTDRYVNTVSPLASDADIQAAVAKRAVDLLFSEVDVSDRITEALPEQAKFLGDTLSAQIQGYATDVTEKLLASDQFQSLWDSMNRVAHQQLVTVLKDENGASRGPAQVKDGKITLDLSQTIETVKVELAKKGLGFLENVSVPPVKRTIVLIDAGGIDRARTASKLLNMVAWLLPIVAIGCFVCSAVMVRPRRRATVRAGIVVFAGAAFTLALLAVGRYFYLDAATPPGGNGKAAAAVWDILLRNLRIGVIVVGLAGLLVAFVAWLSGSTGGAEHLRAIASRGIGALRVKADEAGYVPGPVAEFVAEYKRGLQFAATLLAVVILVLWKNPTIGVVVVIAVLLLLVLGAISFLTRGPSTPAESGNADAGRDASAGGVASAGGDADVSSGPPADAAEDATV